MTPSNAARARAPLLPGTLHLDDPRATDPETTARLDRMLAGYPGYQGHQGTQGTPVLPIGACLTVPAAVTADPAVWLDAIREAEGIDVASPHPGRYVPSVETFQQRPDLLPLYAYRAALTIRELWARVERQDALLAELQRRLDGDGCTRVSYEQFKADVSARGA